MSGLLQLKVGHDDPVNIHAVHGDDPTCGGAKTPGGTFGGLGKEEDKGNKEVSYDEKNREGKPATSVAINKKPSFLRNIRIPLKKILAERDVTPERGESEKEHAHDVIVLSVK